VCVRQERRFFAIHRECIDIVFYDWSGRWRRYVDSKKIAAVTLATLIVTGAAPAPFQSVPAELWNRDHYMFAQRAQRLFDRGQGNTGTWAIERAPDVKAYYLAGYEVDNQGSGAVSNRRTVVRQKAIFGRIQ
jgi:hypothetical protein